MEQQKLSNTGVIIGLGIASILLCWCYGVLGLILSAIALILAANTKKTYVQSPESYMNYSALKTGRVIAIIGLVLNLIVLFVMIWAISQVGWDVIQSGDEELIRERMQDLFS